MGIISASGNRFFRFLQQLQHTLETPNSLEAHQFETVLGTMIAVADKKSLYLLEFVDRTKLEQQINRLQHYYQAPIVLGTNPLLSSIEQEINAYFNGTLYSFTTPFTLIGTPFATQVHKTLIQIPYGHTITYQQQADKLGKSSAARAVANANGMNQLCIIVPCHRVVGSNGSLGGYSAGIERKKWLLAHEQKYCSNNISRDSL